MILWVILHALTRDGQHGGHLALTASASRGRERHRSEIGPTGPVAVNTGDLRSPPGAE